MKMTILTLSICLCFFQIGLSQQKNLSSEQQLLSVFKGHWTIEGSESSYLEVCDWIQGNHIQCISTSKEKDAIDSSVSYLTYSPSEKTFIYLGFMALVLQGLLKETGLATNSYLKANE